MSEPAAHQRSYRYPTSSPTSKAIWISRGHAFVHFELGDASAILRYTADWPEVTFDHFPVVPSDSGWNTHLSSHIAAAT